MEKTEKKRTLLQKLLRISLFSAIGLVALLVLLFILTPFIAPPIAKSIIKSKIGEYVNGNVELKTFSFSWSGAIHLGDFSITPPTSAQPVVSVKDINIKVSLFSLIASKVIADISVDKPEIFVIREKDGKVNLDKLLKPIKVSDARNGDNWFNAFASSLYADDLSNAEPVPFVQLKLDVHDGALNVMDKMNDTVTKFNNIKTAVNIDTLENPIVFDISATEPKADNQTHFAGIKGKLKITKDHFVNMQATSGEMSYDIQNISLENLSAAASVFGPIDSLSGAINGKGSYEIKGMPAIKGSGQIIVENTIIKSKALTPEPISLPRISLISQFTVDAAGSGQQEVTFDAGSLFNAGMTTQFTGINGPAANLDSVIKIKSNVKDISQSLRNVLQLKTSYQLEGNLEGQLKAKIILKDQNLRQADIDGILVVNNLNAVSNSGQKVPIEPGVNMALKAQLDGDKGTANISSFQMDTFFMNAAGNADITQLKFLPKGISAENAIVKSNFTIKVMLSELANKLNSFITLPSINPAGTIEGVLSLSGTSGNINLNGHLTGNKLQASNIPMKTGKVNIGPYDISLDSVGTINMKADADSQINYSVMITDNLAANLLTVNGSSTIKNITQDMDKMIVDGKTDILVNFKPVIGAAAHFMPELMTLLVDGSASTSMKYELKNNVLHLEDQPRIHINSVTGKIGTTSIRGDNIEFQGKRDVTLNLKDKMSLNIKEAKMNGPGLAIAIQGTVNEILGTPQIKMDLHGTIEPEPLGQKIGPLLGGVILSGKPLTMSFELAGTPASLKTKGSMQTEAFAGHGGLLGEPGFSQVNMKCDYDIALELKPESLNAVIKQMAYKSDTATFSFNGTIVNNGLLTPTPNSIVLDAKLSFDADIAKAAHDFAAFISLPPSYSIGGQCNGDMTIKTQKEMISAIGKNSITKFTFSGIDKTKVITETKMDFNYELLFDASKFNFNIKQFELTSGILDGKVSGEILNLAQAPELKGVKLAFTYVPDKVGALIKPLFPVDMKGADKQPLNLSIDGKIQPGADIVASIRQLILEASMGLSEVTWMGITSKGKFDLSIKNEHITSDNKLAVNGGTAELKMIVDLRNASTVATAPVQSALDMNVANVRLNQDMSPILSMIPLFKSSKGTIDGFANSAFHFDWKGSVDLPAIQKDWKAQITAKVSGQGNVAVRDLVITGSSLVGDILSKLSGDNSGTARGELKDSKITFAGGRATYKNMTLVLNQLQIILTGWVQVDEKMDMVMRVPITKELAKQYKGIDKMVGKEIDIPVKGTVTDPKIDWAKALGDLAKQNAKTDAGDKIKDKLKPKPKHK